MRMGLSVVLII